MIHVPRLGRPLALAFVLTTTACGGSGAPAVPGGGGSGGGMAAGGAGGGPGGKPKPVEAKPVQVALSAEQRQEVDRLGALLAETKGLTADALLARRAVPFRPALGYDPGKAVNLDLIQRSALGLTDAERAALRKNGFVVSARKQYPHFAYGYEEIYSQDLPVFVSADSILQAVHQSYDDILEELERVALRPELATLLASMRARLPAQPGLDEATRKDVDLFLAVALGLLDGAPAKPVAGADEKEIAGLVAKATAAAGAGALTLFGAAREVDYSQFKPRGHYVGEAPLEQYFRAMMWLGRIDLPMLQTDPQTGKQLLVRRAVAGALALRGLMDDAGLARWKRIDAAVRAFVGEPDSMAPPEVDRLKADLKIEGADLAGVGDDALAQALVAGAYGRQKILSQIVIQAPHAGAWPLDAVFLFFGQRYVFDSHVFSNVVYDRVAGRMMPDPLDVAYAALGNDHAATLLRPQLEAKKYAPALEAMRRLGDEHGARFWDANLYNLWLGALRSLSPGPDLADAKAGVPAVAATEPWARRVLGAQLASWAQLRHDTILYAKPSYTTGVACEFPDAYVEPVPAFFGALEKFAAQGRAVVGALPIPSGGYLAMRLGTYFARLGEVATILREMAERQRTGMPHLPKHLEFVNQAIRLSRGCGGPVGIQGWYGDLFFNQSGAADFAPTIADVHTQPTDEAGAPVGKVLHVGTGRPKLMVMTVETCQGPRAYAGVVSSYHSVVTEKLERLDDQAWAKRFGQGTGPEEVGWLRAIVTP